MKACLLAFALATAAWGQNFTQRGYLETTALLYPQTASPDSGGDRAHAIPEALFRYEAFYKLTNLHFAGAVDARADTHQETERAWGLSWWDRTRRRPAFAVRRLSATYTRGKLTVEAGKQPIRWGKADVLTPTDRFAPRDFLNVVDGDFLAVTAARLTYGTQANTIDLVFAPRLTPSRVPLLGQRWAALPAGIPIQESKPDLGGGPQVGARWNHIGALAEYSVSFYNGSDHLPLFRLQPNFAPLRAVVPSAEIQSAESQTAEIESVKLQRFYPQMRMYGADLAVPLGPVSVKGEAAYFTSANPLADEYVLWVIQLERQAGEWSLVAGYTGQAVTQRRSALGFSPVRGFTRAVVAHAGYTIDINRSVAFEGVVRQNGQGVYLKAEYSQAFGQHWRATAGFALIRGDPTDFLGQYRRNSHAILRLRYSF